MLPSWPADNNIRESKGWASKTNTSSSWPYGQINIAYIIRTVTESSSNELQNKDRKEQTEFCLSHTHTDSTCSNWPFAELQTLRRQFETAVMMERSQRSHATMVTTNFGDLSSPDITALLWTQYICPHRHKKSNSRTNYIFFLLKRTTFNVNNSNCAWEHTLTLVIWWSCPAQYSSIPAVGNAKSEPYHPDYHSQTWDWRYRGSQHTNTLKNTQKSIKDYCTSQWTSTNHNTSKTHLSVLLQNWIATTLSCKTKTCIKIN